MLLPTVSHIPWNVAVEPVKWMPARSGEASAGSPTSAPAPGTMLMTPGGSPADSRMSMMTWAAYTAVEAGFQTTVLRSEEHTSELQSLAYLVCRLLLEKKKQPTPHHTNTTPQ